jgi:hypothetical protein
MVDIKQCGRASVREGLCVGPKLQTYQGCCRSSRLLLLLLLLLLWYQ